MIKLYNTLQQGRRFVTIEHYIPCQLILRIKNDCAGNRSSMMTGSIKLSIIKAVQQLAKKNPNNCQKSLVWLSFATAQTERLLEHVIAE